MKAVLIALAAIALTAGSAMAAERGRHSDRHYDRPGHVTGFERARIARSAAHLAQVRKRVWADGRVSRFERYQLRSARYRHAAVVNRARRF